MMGTSSKVVLRLALAWLIGLGGTLATHPSTAVAADEPRDEPVVSLQATGETLTYEDQTGAQVRAVSDGWDLDQYLFRAASPVNFAIEVSRDFGPVDAEGHPAPGNALFGLSGRITLRVFDVDDDAQVGPEVDTLYVNGTEVGTLSGADNQWSINTFEFPLELLRLPTTGNPQGRNDFEVDIDTTNNGWAVEVDWAELRLIEDFVPLGLVHGFQPGERLADVSTYFVDNQVLEDDEIVAPLHTTTNLESGADEIDPSINDLMADTGGHHVNLIAHSYGGLVARLYAWDHPSAVDKIVLVGTPNGGTELADAACLVNDAGPWGRIVWAGQLFDDQFGVCGGPEDALFQLQTDYVRNVFNANVRDRSGTEYWVLSGALPDEDRFLGIDFFPGADDGVVPLDSSQYLLIGRPDHPGKHRILGTLPLEHGMLIEEDSDVMPLSACELYGEQCAAPSTALLQAQAASTSDQVIGDFGGVQVPAGGTAVIDLQFEGAEKATIVVVSDQLGTTTPTLTGASFESANLFETEVLAAALTTPPDGQLQILNTGTELASVVALVGVPAGRELSVAASPPHLVAPNSLVQVSVSLTEAGSAETMRAEVQSPNGSIVPVALTQNGTETWDGSFTPSEAGIHTVTAWVEGSRPRFDSALFSVTSGQAQLSGAFSERLDGAEDGLADSLVVAPELTTAVAGRYRLAADLADATGALIASAGTTADLPVGTSSADLAFSGRAIFESATAGPYRIVNVVLSRDEAGMILEDQVDELGSTAAYDYRSFDHFPIAFDLDEFTDVGVDANGDGVFEELRVQGSVTVETSGTYAVNARLLAPDRTELVEFQTTMSMSAGINPLTLTFDGEPIGNSTKDGPYTVADLSVYPLASADTLGYLVTAHLTTAYTAAQFGALEPSTWAWGRNEAGQLGTASTETCSNSPCSTAPLEAEVLTEAVAVAGGFNHSVALLPDGTVWTWGANGSGQLGDGTTTWRTEPAQVPGLTNVSAIAAGTAHSLALRSDGTVWAWGANTFGALGDGTTTTRLSPIQVSALTTATAIDAGSYHSLALLGDGTVRAWGANGAGELGDNTFTQRTTPVAVFQLSGASAIAAAGQHSHAIKTNGTAWSWGHNGEGQLGNGSTSNQKKPVQVSGLSGVSLIGAGFWHTLAIMSDGTARAWGRNTWGQLGDGTTTRRTTPVVVSGLSGATAIDGGGAHSLAIADGGVLWTWGKGLYGQLGSGATSNRLTAQPVAGLDPVAALAGGTEHSLVVLSAGP